MKKTLSLILALLMLLSMFLAVACAETKGDEKETTGETEAEETEAETLSDLEQRNAIDDELPDNTYEGKDFFVLGRERSDFVYDCAFELELEECEDNVDEALYKRNKKVEDRFDVTLQYVSGGSSDDAITALRASVQSGLDEYQLMISQCIPEGSATIEGNYLDWALLTYVDLEKPWYIGNARDTLSINGHAYIMAGEFDLDILRFTYCMFFNKTIAENYQLGNIYEIVSNGEWTYDKLNEFVKLIYEDLDSSEDKSAGDLYALTGDYYSATITYQYAFNSPVMSKDSDGIPEVVFNQSGKMTDIAEKLVSLYAENGAYCFGWSDDYANIFDGGRSLLYMNLFGHITSLRDNDLDYGIIPYPKYDTAQDSYYTMSDGAHGCMAVPTTVSDVDFVSIIIEALNAETYKLVIPEYYEKALKVKYSRDNESVEVLDMLLNARTFDFGYIFDGWKGYAFLLQKCTETGKADMESRIASTKNQAEKHYTEIIDGLLALSEG